MEEDDYDSDECGEDGDNYMWVEDEYAPADDLVEMVVPDPPVHAAPEEEWDDLTRFEYWNDIEYDSDGYHDQDEATIRKPQQLRGQMSAMNLSQRTSKKRKASFDLNQPTKRAKREFGQSSSLQPVLFIHSRHEPKAPICDVDSMKEYSLLPNWREWIAEHEFAGQAALNHQAEASVLEEEDQEHDQLDDNNVMMLALQNALRAGLEQQGLASAGMSQDKLLKIAQSMLSNGGDTEAEFDELIEDIHAVDADDDDHDDADADPFAQWVTQQLGAGKTAQLGTSSTPSGSQGIGFSSLIENERNVGQPIHPVAGGKKRRLSGSDGKVNKRTALELS